jgi:23S rRNA (uracil1939-C5)-methyltransferase
MDLTPGSDVEIVPERPVAGGRMLARHDGRVVLVAGAIPGERVRIRIARRAKGVILADVVEVLDASADRRVPAGDPACGGALYAHVAYPRQLALKADVIRDAFRRLGRIEVEGPVAVMPSPETGYRLRAALHVRGGRLGFFREGTHELCDVGPTGQVLPETLEAVASLAATLGRGLSEYSGVIVAENVAATERVLHLEARADRPARGSAGALPLPALAGVTGVTMSSRRGRPVTLAGTPTVSDAAPQIFGDDVPVSGLAAWTRHATSFFQGNRWLVGALARRVLEVATGERVVDLYAGVGLFSVVLAARGAVVVAVEGDASSGADLAANAGPWRDRLLVVRADVESAVAEPPAETPDAVVVDPPRTGLSKDATTGLLAWRAPRLVYVSCDPPTLARDAARLVASGYRLVSVEAFDFFPNTPHVETLAVFDVG